MCWQTDLVTRIMILLPCPVGLSSHWVEGFEPPESLSIHSPPPLIKWRSLVPFDHVVNSSSGGADTNYVPHANLHSCVTSEVNFCTPSIAVTPGLNTQTNALSGFLTDGSIEFSSSLLIGLNNQSTRTTWTVLAHTRVFAYADGSDGQQRLYQWDWAIGTTSTVYNDPFFDEPSEALKIALYVIAAIEMFLIVVTVLFILLKIRHTIIRASSPLFLIWMCFFALLGLSAVFPYGVSPQTDSTCIVVIWLAGVGFIGVFAPLLAKTFRLWRILTNQSLKGLEITNAEVALYSLLLMAPEVIIFIIWSAADPPEPTPIYNADISFKVVCRSDVNDLWIALITGYQLIVLFVGLILAYLTRNLTTLFNESTYIGYSIVVMLGAAILAPVQFTNGSGPDSILVLQCVQVLLYGLVIYFICWPKFFRIVRGENPDISNIMLHTGRSGTSGSHATAGTSNDSVDEGTTSGGVIKSSNMMRNGDLKPGARKALRALHARLDPLNDKIAAADPINDSDVQAFVQEFQTFQSRFS